MRLICSLFDRSTNPAQTASRILAVLCGFAGTLAVESLHAAEAAHGRTLFADIIDGVDSSILDIGPDTARIALTLEGEYLVFKRDSHQQVADGMVAWSGKDVQGKDATSLFIAKNGDDSSIKLAKGDFEYDITKDGRGDYELRATNLKDTVVDECLTDSDPKVQSAAGQDIGTDSITTSEAPTTSAAASTFAAATTFTAAQPFEITVNLAYTKAALAQFPSATALKNAFVIGLTRVNNTLKNSNLNVRVKLGRVVFVDRYRQNTSLRLVRQDVELGRVPGLPVPTGKNKTVLVVDVFGKWTGTAMLGGPYIVIKHHAISTLTFAHEMGHSFGGIHEKTYPFRNGRYTSMLQSGGGLREPIYSNPNVQWFGERAGTATLSNAQRMCSEFFKLGRGCWITPQ
jgi:hypothetical protein